MTAPRRVGLVLATSTGGVGVHVRSLAAELVGAGWSVSVFGPADTQRRFDFAAVGADFAALEIGPRPRPVADFAAIGRLRRLGRGVDVVHAHGLRAGLVATLAVAWPRVVPREWPPVVRRPLVVTWHNLMLRDTGLSRLVETVTARGADLTLGASADVVDRARARGAHDVRLVEVAAPALRRSDRDRADLRRELGAPAGHPVVLAVGRLHEQKGFDTLVEAATGWRDRRPAPVVWIAGTGPERARLERLVADLGVPVRLIGHRIDVADLLAAADVVVLPSKWEARSLVAQEAMRAGRPLVASAVGGIPELLGHGGGVLVPPDDAAALGGAVRRLLDDPGAAAALGKRAAHRARNWPDGHATARAVAACYTELLAVRGSPQ